MIMYLLDKQQNIVQAISDGFIEAKMTEEINAADKLVFSLVQNKRLPSSVYYVCIPATRGDAFLMFKVISETVEDDRTEYTCIESAYDELKSYNYIKDVRPQDKTASEMLQIALTDTRWEVGYTQETVRKRTNFYYISTLEAIQKVVELFKVELTFTVVIDPITNRIVRRQVNLYSQQGERTGKRFEYGSNLLSVTREESSEDLVTALVGRGKGEQLDDGNDDTVDGYGRRIMFTDVVWSKANGNPTDKPAGQEYVEDKEATKLYGFDDGKPRIGIAVFEDIEDVNQLINATWAALQVAKRPKVSFKASALDIGDLGLGDTVAIIRHELNIEYFTRVYKVEHDLLDKNNNVIELGDDFNEKSLTNYVASVKEAQEETTRVANIALTSANGKNKNFYSNVKPTNAAEGDNLFLDLGNGETEYYVWHNGNWELVISTVDIDNTKKEVDKALQDIDAVRAQANDAYNSAQSARSSADSIYQSFMDMQLNISTQLSEIDTRAQTGVQDALNYVTRLDKQYSDFEKAINGKVDKNASDSAKLIADVSASTKVLSDKVTAQQRAISELTTSLDGVKGQYATLDGRVTKFSAGIDGLNAQLKDTKNQLAGVKLTAEGAAASFVNAQGDIANLQTKANSIGQQLLKKVGNDTFESYKNSTAQVLSTKLTASDLNGYAKTSEVRQTADGLQASITSVNNTLKVYKTDFDLLKDGMSLRVSEITDLNNRFNSLNIGGRNYLQGSLDFTWRGGIIRNGVNTKADIVNSDDNVGKMVHVTGNQYNGGIYTAFKAAFPNGELQIGEEYTLSFDAKGSGIFSGVGNESGERNQIDGVALTNNWKRYNVSGKILTLGKPYTIYFKPNFDAYIRRVKIEKGNKATDYTQAPEDIQGEIDNTNTKFSALDVKVNNISSIVANKSDKSYVDQTANTIRSSVSDKASFSYVDQKAREINSVVANKADISLVNQKADQWQLELKNLQVGGTNLLHGTKNYQGWILNASGREDDNNVKTRIVHFWFNQGQQTARDSSVVSINPIHLVKGQQYTISCKAKYYSSNPTGREVGGRSLRMFSSYTDQHGGEGFLLTNKLTDQWKKYSCTFTSDTTGDYDAWRVIDWVDGNFPGGSIYIAEIKIEEGNKATDWSPAPEDTKTAIDSAKAETNVAITAVRNDLTSAINLRVQKNELISQINLQAGKTLIQTNKLYLDADSVAFSGRAFIPSAAITNLQADKITTGTLNAARVNIINLDVNNLVGNRTEFVKTSWKNAYGQYVNIDYSGMRVSYTNTTTTFNDSGMEIVARGENIGGIGWQGMRGMPSNYQGLLFWLDGGGDYMAWAARNNGNYSDNPKIKFSWYRNEWRPSNTPQGGFWFYDSVTFADSIYPSSGTSDGMGIRIYTTNYAGHRYPTIGSKSGKSGIMIGDYDIFIIFNNKVYPLEGWKIPKEMQSDGKVASWQTIN